MNDFVWVLRHPTNPLTKTWKLDGSIETYSDPKQFIGKEVQVSSIHDLSKLLAGLESEKNTCVIRGKYKGFDYSKKVEPEETKPGRVLRRKSVHDDVPHHWILVDIDNYEPFDADPILDPVGAIEEFITLHLPAPFHGVSFHWQLSSSAGHPSKGLSKLKAHVWFWLKTPYTSSQLRTWATVTNYRADKALLDTIQVHYTAAPIIEDGVTNPITKRSGFTLGDFGDTVDLVIAQSILDTAPDVGASVSRSQRLQATLTSDPVVTLLAEKKMVKGKRGDGGLNIVCPREEHHTGESGESSTIYYPAHTGGYMKGTFVCLHEHCRGVPQSLFLDALGYDDAGDVFTALPDDSEPSPVRRKRIPEALHLCTDQANANRLAGLFKGKAFCCNDRWYSWDSRRWKPDDDGQILSLGMNLSKLVTKEEHTWRTKKAKSSEEKERNEKIADALAGWSKKSEMMSTINAALSMVKRLLNMDSRYIDSDHHLINYLNGTFDIRTGTLKPHDPEDYITHLQEVELDLEADCPIWTKTLLQITREDDKRDHPVADWLQTWFGYCATGLTREQKFVVMWGNGRNGKSTIVETVASIFCDYAGTAAPNLLVSTDRSRHPTEIADLFGRRLVTAHESGENCTLREDFVKHVTGGDKIKARFMNKDFFEFPPTHKLQLLTNHKPTIKGQDEGIWRRVVLVPFTAKFGTVEEVESGAATHVMNPNLLEVLKTEKKGIANWIAQGARQWGKYGLRTPQIILAASKEYQTDQDRTLQFINEVCQLGDDFECYLTNGEQSGIYPAYVRWCRLSGIHPLSKINFTTNLERVVPGFSKSEKWLTDGGRQRKVVRITGLRCPEYYEM